MEMCSNAGHTSILAVSANSSKESKCSSVTNKGLYLDIIRGSFAEFVGTALYVFAGVTSFSNFVENQHPHLPTVALTFGFSFAGLSASFQHVR